MRLLLSLALCGRVAARPTVAAVDTLRRQLLTNADSAIPPYPSGGGPTDVAMQIRIFKVLEVDISTGRLLLKVWRRLTWNDERLRWDPAAHGDLRSLTLFPKSAAGGSQDALDNNMWTPDLYLVNSMDQETMDVGAAYVYPSGDVFWSVPGQFDAHCKFSGLAQFPHDELSCPLEFLSWGHR